jgi:hypothetical protein
VVRYSKPDRRPIHLYVHPDVCATCSDTVQSAAGIAAKREQTRSGLLFKATSLFSSLTGMSLEPSGSSSALHGEGMEAVDRQGSFVEYRSPRGGNGTEGGSPRSVSGPPSWRIDTIAQLPLHWQWHCPVCWVVSVSGSVRDIHPSQQWNG